MSKVFALFEVSLSLSLSPLPLHPLSIYPSLHPFLPHLSSPLSPSPSFPSPLPPSSAGVYKEDHPCIRMFWEVILSFTEKEKQQLLKFVTSCSRPPLLGFKELHPSFHISPGQGDERLPSASTCMNVLKLPLYHDKETMKSKILYAIQSGAGFELS